MYPEVPSPGTYLFCITSTTGWGRSGLRDSKGGRREKDVCMTLGVQEDLRWGSGL